MIVGAVAVGVWGRPRATADIDVTVLVDETGLEEIAREAESLGLHVDRQWLDWNPLLRGTQVRLAATGVVVDAMRPRDFEDAVGVLVAQRAALDERYMADWAVRLTIADELAYVLRESE
jgi:hypothetical protein